MPFRVSIVDDEPWTAIDAQHSIDGRDSVSPSASTIPTRPTRSPASLGELQPDSRGHPNAVMDGLELIRRLKEMQVQARFAILSGYSDFEYARTALRLGVEDYFVKPLEPKKSTASSTASPASWAARGRRSPPSTRSSPACWNTSTCTRREAPPRGRRGFAGLQQKLPVPPVSEEPRHDLCAIPDAQAPRQRPPAARAHGASAGGRRLALRLFGPALLHARVQARAEPDARGIPQGRAGAERGQ